MKRFTLGIGKRLTTALAVTAAGIGVLASSLAFAALLGVEPGLPKIVFNSSSGTATTYSKNTLRFSVAADPINYFPPGFQFVANSTSDGPKSFALNINVDNAGNLVGGVPGDDLVIIGAVDTTGDAVLDADGVLLTGEIVAFGFAESGATDLFDFRFEVTGGELAPDYADEAIGVVLTVENSTFSGSFNTNFRGWAKGNVGPIPEPDIDIEKFTNGYDADAANGFQVVTPPDGPGFPGDVGGTQVPLVVVGDPIVWTYVVTNSGLETLVNVTVTDSEGVAVNCPQNTLNPGETMTCTGNGVGLDLDMAMGANIVDGCDGQGQGMTQPTYENVGSVVGTGQTSGLDVTAEDPSHYCNPEIFIEKFTNGYDADAANGFPIPTPPNGPGFPGDVGGTQVPVVVVGDTITWTYVVTNPGPEKLINVSVSDSKLVTVTCPQNFLDPGTSMTCTAVGNAEDLANSGGDGPGCDSQGQGTPVPTYENIGTVIGTGENSGVVLTGDDPSHYCNPPKIIVEKFTNGHDGDNANGNPTAGNGAFNVGAIAVAEVPSGGQIVWTYRVTNNGNETLINVVVTDDRNVTVTCPKDTLIPGESMDCTAMGVADDLTQTGGDVQGCDAQGQGMTRPTYENLGMVVGEGQTTGIDVEDDDPSHYCNPIDPPCDLTIEKTCALPPSPPGNDAECKGKLKQFTMIWDGADGTSISGQANDSSGTVNGGDVVTFFGPFSNNDVVVNVDSAESQFHVSCSDDDMDGDSTTNDAEQQVPGKARDCGKMQGNGKDNNDATLVNEWLLEGFIDDDDDVLDCGTNAAPGGDTNCEFTPAVANCDTVDNVEELTYVYSGGNCPGNNTQGSKSSCSGTNNGQPVTVMIEDGPTLFNVSVGDSFVVTIQNNPDVISLSNTGSSQVNEIHTSCSAPLVAGETYGALTLVALNGIGNGKDIEYAYKVTNTGLTTVTNIDVSDDKLGAIGSIPSLAPAASDTLTKTAFITQTTTNVASVVGDGPAGANCADSNPVVVTVLPPPPPPVSCKDIEDIIQLTMVWDGPNGVDVVAEGGEVFNNVQQGGQITFGTVGLGNDIELTLTGSVTGTSEFHISCSDEGMNGTEDCANHQGNGKGNDSNLNNQWLLGIMTGQNGQFDCSDY